MSSAPLPPPILSAEMQGILTHQRQIKEWQRQVNARIQELEESYLDGSTMGNIVKGWDQDAKPLQKKGGVEDKERIFSNSSLPALFVAGPLPDHHQHHGVVYKSNSHKAGSHKRKS